MSIFGTIVRFIVSALVLMVVAFIIPGFTITFGSAILAAIVIALMGWVLEMLFGERVTPYSRGLVGFISAAVVIYLTQYFVPNMRIGIFGAIIAALLIGLIDLFVPTSFDRTRKEG